MNSTEVEVMLDQEVNKNEDRYLVPGLIRGLAILALFDEDNQEMTISEIAEKIDVNRSSAFRLIYTLEHCGYLRKLSQKTYALDSRVMSLGFNSLSKQSLNELSSPIMKELRDRIKIAVHLSILEGTNVVFINNVQSMGAFTSTLQIGTHWPAHATVIGQLMLSRLPTPEVKRRYKDFSDWKVFSERTPHDLESLLARLEHVRKEPFMVSWGHFNADMAACAAPVYNQSNKEMIAVLSVSCPISTYDEETFHTKVSQSVIHHADKISKFIYI
ncbi:IclR family transcriptional regulator [Acinetobacter faecalis]|uniref:IclR family transcriptional regulator n=1 Tax=Acinetobacter faecalis TaxID=2665161 RepID=UPI002A9188A6|nr:IclR family transcriptional regulator [Acinetobacter faecalis]MDY6450238.1 IclR family transcriptional regulator [Acinetobacter faecalis]MDY6462561.1 IclR family transcriptional regulator [Acinetobacter faecalis]MDY6480904.1 IclR family transcriptional regulator [Acinetobacter faecalis]